MIDRYTINLLYYMIDRYTINLLYYMIDRYTINLLYYMIDRYTINLLYYMTDRYISCIVHKYLCHLAWAHQRSHQGFKSDTVHCGFSYSTVVY